MTGSRRTFWHIHRRVLAACRRMANDHLALNSVTEDASTTRHSPSDKMIGVTRPGYHRRAMGTGDSCF
jgi:hypothetical protein